MHEPHCTPGPGVCQWRADLGHGKVSRQCSPHTPCAATGERRVGCQELSDFQQEASGLSGRFCSDGCDERRAEGPVILLALGNAQGNEDTMTSLSAQRANRSSGRRFGPLGRHRATSASAPWALPRAGRMAAPLRQLDKTVTQLEKTLRWNKIEIHNHGKNNEVFSSPHAVCGNRHAENGRIRATRPGSVRSPRRLSADR